MEQDAVGWILVDNWRLHRTYGNCDKQLKPRQDANLSDWKLGLIKIVMIENSDPFYDQSFQSLSSWKDAKAICFKMQSPIRFFCNIIPTLGQNCTKFRKFWWTKSPPKSTSKVGFLNKLCSNKK